MSVHRNLEIFNKMKPKIQLGITIATFYDTPEQLWQRILIKMLFFSTIFSLVSSTFHILNTFQGEFTGNLAMSFMLWTGCTQILSKSIIMRYHRSNLLELLGKVQELHNNFENNELNSMAEKNLKKFSNIWETCYK